MEIFSINFSRCGRFAGNVGLLCKEENWPLLNSIIINQKDYMPSSGYDDWKKSEKVKSKWSEDVSNCWKKSQKFNLEKVDKKIIKHFDVK